MMYRTRLALRCDGVVMNSVSDEKVGERPKGVKCKDKSRYNE